MTPAQFNKIIVAHYKRWGRHDMPWRKTRDPYRILVSEVMLQQTPVGRVGPFYEKFIKKFPSFKALARANTGSILRTWQGLGYNRRALALQGLSRIVLERFNGRLPHEREALETLPGIGKGTSGSLEAFVFNKPVIFIETNVRRVFIHCFFPKKKMVTDAAIERYITRTINKKHPREWYWAVMDYGAQLAHPRVETKKLPNPNRRSANHVVQSTFKGSDRELRGKILRFLFAKEKATIIAIANELGEPFRRTQKITFSLVREGFLGTKGMSYCISKN